MISRIVSTNDSKSASVSYTVAANDADTSFPLNIYRDANATYTVGAVNLLGAPDAVTIANLTISGDDAMAGAHTITVSPYGTPSATYAFSQANALRPDPSHKYVIAAADETGALASGDVQPVPQSEFRIFLIGAVAHGYVGSLLGLANSETGRVYQTSFPGEDQDFVDDYRNELISIDGYDNAIAFHWEQFADLAAPDQATGQGAVLEQKVVAAAVALNAASNDVIDLNLIGWSRGTVVVNSALTDLNQDSSIPAQMKSGFIGESLVDPHPANNDISQQNTYLDTKDGSAPTNPSKLAQTAVAVDGYTRFQDAAHDLQHVGFVIPPEVDAVSDMYQHNPCYTMSGQEAILNLWGLSP